MSPLDVLFSASGILASGALLLILALGYFLGRATKVSGRASGDAGLPGQEASETMELRRSLRRMEQEVNELTVFFVTLPDLIRQLNSNRDKRHIAPLLLKLVDVIFEPAQICVFYLSRDGSALKLAASKGLPRSVEDQGLEVSLTEGRIGWVAQHQMVMDTRDFSTASNFRGEGLGPASRLRIDLCAPMVDSDDNTSVGVITLGGLTRYPRNEKKMIKMVADLGSLGIKNAEYHQRIQTLANEDSLTKLYNKRFGSDKLALSINDAEQHNRTLSIFLFDIDHFKNYNDTNGHLAGDDILRQLGRIVLGTIRADDYAIRFGGEEFLVVFQDTDKEGALIAAEKIRRQVEGYPFPFQENQPGGKLTISGGVAAFRTDSRSSKELIALADEALYEAKKRGRNRVIACRTPYLSGASEPVELPVRGETA